MGKYNHTLGKFSDDAADILIDGKKVGWIERNIGERFASAGSYARVKFVSGYTLTFTDDALSEEQGRFEKQRDIVDYDTLPEAREAIDLIAAGALHGLAFALPPAKVHHVAKRAGGRKHPPKRGRSAAGSTRPSTRRSRA